MFRKTIKYTNYNDQEVTQDFYFHLSKAELLEMGVGNMQERLQRIIASKDNTAILQEFKALIKLAVGIRSEDGETFIKNDQAKNLLLFSPAYDELLFELCTDAKAATEFIKQLLPEKMQKEMQAQLGIQDPETKGPDPFAEPKDDRPAWLKENRTPTPAELVGASEEELRIAFARKLGVKE